jgi:leucyl-tRNA synthetase
MRSERYNAREAETRWQKIWDERAIFKTRNDDPRPKSTPWATWWRAVG